MQTRGYFSPEGNHELEERVRARPLSLCFSLYDDRIGNTVVHCCDTARENFKSPHLRPRGTEVSAADFPNRRLFFSPFPLPTPCVRFRVMEWPRRFVKVFTGSFCALRPTDRRTHGGDSLPSRSRSTHALRCSHVCVYVCVELGWKSG